MLLLANVYFRSHDMQYMYVFCHNICILPFYKAVFPLKLIMFDQPVYGLFFNECVV